MTEKLTAKEYVTAMRDLRARIDPEEFIRANNYIQAAGKMTGSFEVENNWATIQSVTEAALRLFEIYPQGMPLTFPQLMKLEEKGIDTPPATQVPDWWAGRI